MRQGSTWDARCRSGDSCFHERLRVRKDRPRDRQLNSQAPGSVVRRNPDGEGSNQGLRPPTRTRGLLVQRNLHPTPLPNAGVSDGQSGPIHTPVRGRNRLRPHPKSFEAAIGGGEIPGVTETCSALHPCSVVVRQYRLAIHRFNMGPSEVNHGLLQLTGHGPTNKQKRLMNLIGRFCLWLR